MKLVELVEKIKSAKNLSERMKWIDQAGEVKFFQKKGGAYRHLIKELPPECVYVFKVVLATGQKHIFATKKRKKSISPELRTLLENLVLLDEFYREIGGLLGYQIQVENLLQKKGSSVQGTIHSPKFIDISEEAEETRKMVYEGIKNLPQMCELYPIGGAADRLHLKDEKTHLELPAARLFFHGKTLLETLIFDVQAKEYLYFKLFQKRVYTPIALMTSDEKDNHRHVISLFIENKKFGRPKDTIKIFRQPSVPTITEKGEWSLKEPFDLLLKPGGHGAIWKLAKMHGIFEWLKKKKRKKALIRQINNPLSGMDYGLLAFTGLGTERDMRFGFASCPRQVGSAEGVNVLIKNGKKCRLTNIEYCDFPAWNIVDEPFKKGEKYSKFTSNTNILFADLSAIEKATLEVPLPGALINLKEVRFPSGGDVVTKKVARLETTMQNIADAFVEEKEEEARSLDKSFITFHKRHKTISTVKKVYKPPASPVETPEKCFYDFLFNAQELLLVCGVKFMKLPSFETFMKEKPPFLFRYHPALGPLYSVIWKKLRGGKLAKNAEIVLDIAEGDFENIQVDGSLCIHADQIMGEMKGGALHYSENVGRCVLRNVRVKNRGIKTAKSYWKKTEREEALTIHLEKNGEFFAEDVEFLGNQTFVVEENTKLTVYQENGMICVEKKKIDAPSWFWRYEVKKDYSISLKKEIAKAYEPILR